MPAGAELAVEVYITAIKQNLCVCLRFVSDCFCPKHKTRCKFIKSSPFFEPQPQVKEGGEGAMKVARACCTISVIEDDDDDQDDNKLK